jgi:hypothetical protein
MNSKIIRPIGANVGEVVRIKWRAPNGDLLEEDHTAPPRDTWLARHQEQTKQPEPEEKP